MVDFDEKIGMMYEIYKQQAVYTLMMRHNMIGFKIKPDGSYMYIQPLLAWYQAHEGKINPEYKQ